MCNENYCNLNAMIHSVYVVFFEHLSCLFVCFKRVHALMYNFFDSVMFFLILVTLFYFILPLICFSNVWCL